jgi:hypothetical protein
MSDKFYLLKLHVWLTSVLSSWRLHWALNTSVHFSVWTQRKNKTQETKRIKQIVSNVTALLWLSDLFLVTWRRLWKPTRRETFSFCVQTLKWTDVFRAQCKRQLDRTDVSHTCSFNDLFNSLCLLCFVFSFISPFMFSLLFSVSNFYFTSLSVYAPAWKIA